MPSLIETLRDLTPMAESAGLRCRAEASERVTDDDWLRRVFTALKELVDERRTERGAAALRDAIVNGNPSGVTSDARLIHKFVMSVEAGARGVSPNGGVAVFEVEGVRVAAFYNPRTQTLMVTRNLPRPSP